MTLSLKPVTLIAVAGINFDITIEALLKSSKHIEFFDVKIVTPEKPFNLPNHIKWEKSPPLRLRGKGFDDYSHYCLYDLWKHVDTSHCLVVQGDGYVINPGEWNEEFLKYDYIGAPWPISNNSYIDPFGNHQRVGNGGFSLRSKKLLEVPKNYDVVWNVNQGEFYKHMNAESFAEDGNICVHNKHVYEAAGCIFAPLDVAMSFSRELPIEEYDGRKTFGFHRYLPE